MLLFGAGFAAYWGVRQSPPAVVEAAPQTMALVAPEATTEAPMLPPTSPAADTSLTQRLQDEARVAVVVLARDVPAHTLLSADDLAVEQLRIAPPDSFADPNLLVGRVVWRDLPAGTLLSESSFGSGGPLARMIRPDERALTIAIDEVMGGGGHLQPGDFVDVLLFLPEDDRNADRTAQLLVPALRVLGVGDALGMTLAGEAAAPLLEQNNNDARRARSDGARTAVLAVPDALLTRFALATQVGRMSLAVRSAEEELLQ
ncbi:MAG TPA: Flp pilus assembly protein CpaB, partial [Hyphomicrobiales bacterium]|nr:Flp pilus assembly protein CpaB [Hyphomicrobiales bacterium]